MSTQPVAAQVEAAVMARGGEVRGGEVYFLCPIHADSKPSARWDSQKGTWYCDPCKRGGGTLDLAKRLGVPIGSAKPAAQIVATYDYQDETGHILYQTIRMQPKAFKQRQPDGNGGWVWSLKGLRRVLYRLPELVASDPTSWVFVVEGEKDVDGLRLHGLTATTSPMGAGKWRSEYAAFLAGRRVCVLPDNDPPGREHGRDVVESLRSLAAEVKLLELPELPPKGDVSDWLAAGHTAGELLALVDAAPSALENSGPQHSILAPQTLDDVIAAFRRWMHLPDPAELELALGATVANLARGEPIWLLLVGAPGSGKTEILNALTSIPHTCQVGTLTEAALLSGVSKRDVVEGAKGGLLNQIGEFGILILKDFGSVLSMNKDSRGQVLAALREIYDGHWHRDVGSDGGRRLEWAGKLGLVGGSTSIIDEHYAVIGQLGDRFAFCRMKEGSDEERAEAAIEHGDDGPRMRDELAAVVRGLLGGVDRDLVLPPLALEERDCIVAMASLTCRGRSAVARDRYHRDVTLIPPPEVPTRFAIMLSLLYRSLKHIGCEHEECWRLVLKVALDSMPQTRRSCLDLLVTADIWLSTTDIGTRLGYPTTTVRRALEELNCFKVVQRQAGGAGMADSWSVTDWTRRLWKRATTFPAKQGAVIEQNVGESGDGTFPAKKGVGYRGCESVNQSGNPPIPPFLINGEMSSSTVVDSCIEHDKCRPTTIKDRDTCRMGVLPQKQENALYSAPFFAGTHGLSFDVTEDWQPLPEGAVVGAGCEFRLNLSNGKREVRLDPRAWVPSEDEDSYAGYEGG